MTNIKCVPANHCNMKKAFLLGITGILFLLSGCEKFLDKVPGDFISPENYFTKEADVRAALAGVYDILGKEEVYGMNIPLSFSVSDEGFYSRSAFVSGPAVYNYDASDPSVASLWKFLYQGIERANLLLANVDKVSMDSTAKRAAIGETKFLRAYYYFMLADFWGDVPLKTEPATSVNNTDIARTPQREVYDFILREMEEAEGMVYTATQLGTGGHVSKTTVEGILARVCLKMAGEPLKDVSMYGEALKWAKKVVYPDSGPSEHFLNSNFKNIFIRYCSDQYDVRESMWEAEFYGNRNGDFEAGRIGNAVGLQCNDEVYGFSYGFINTTVKLFNSYEAADERRDWTIAPYSYTYNVVNGVSTVKDSTFFTAAQIYNRNAGKWRRIYEKVLPRNKNYTPENFPLLRYSDVLLMLAEAENEVNGPTTIAKAALKAVRDRAKASDVTTSVSSQTEFRTLVRDERFRELAFEGLRKHDLIRWGSFVITMNQLGSSITNTAETAFKYAALAGNNVTQRDVLLPIPVLEISLNKAITQNPGW